MKEKREGVKDSRRWENEKFLVGGRKSCARCLNCNIARIRRVLTLAGGKKDKIVTVLPANRVAVYVTVANCSCVHTFVHTIDRYFCSLLSKPINPRNRGQPRKRMDGSAAEEEIAIRLA